MKLFIPILITCAAVVSFVMYTNPGLSTLNTLQATAAQYDQALGNSKELEQKRDSLNATYRTFTPDELGRLSALLPDNADNIRYILTIQGMAQSYGMSITSLKFDSKQGAAPVAVNPTAAVSSSQVAQASQDYGTFDLQFTTTSTYENFLKFTKDLESNLRLTDIESIDFSSPDEKGLYTYVIRLKTYWLKG